MMVFSLLFLVVSVVEKITVVSVVDRDGFHGRGDHGSFSDRKYGGTQSCTHCNKDNHNRDYCWDLFR